MEHYNCNEPATTCEKDNIYKIVSNNNDANNKYYNTDRMIKIIKVNEASVPQQGDTRSPIVPKSYEAKADQNKASLGFSQNDLDNHSLKLNKCTLVSGSIPAAGGKRTKKTIKRRRKGRKRRSTKRNKRQ